MNSICFINHYTEREGGKERKHCSRSLFTPLSVPLSSIVPRGGGGNSIQFRVGVVAVDTALLNGVVNRCVQQHTLSCTCGVNRSEVYSIERAPSSKDIPLTRTACL